MSRQWTKAIYINAGAVLLQLGSNNALIDGRMGTQQWPTIFVIRCPIYLGDWRTFLPGLLYIPCPQLLGCGQILLRVVTFCVVTPRAVSIYYALSTIYHRELRLPIIDASPCPRPPPRWCGCVLGWLGTNLANWWLVTFEPRNWFNIINKNMKD